MPNVPAKYAAPLAVVSSADRLIRRPVKSLQKNRPSGRDCIEMDFCNLNQSILRLQSVTKKNGRSKEGSTVVEPSVPDSL